MTVVTSTVMGTSADEAAYSSDTEKLYDDKAKFLTPCFEDNDGSPARLVIRKCAPPYLRRAYIFTGYLVGGTPREATWRTLAAWNNETLNAWTMLIGAATAVWYYNLASGWFPRDRLPFGIFLASAIVHTPFSVGLHCNIGVSFWHAETWRTADVFFIFTCSVLRAAAMGWHVFPAPLAFWTYLLGVLALWLYCVVTTMVVRPLHRVPKMTLTKDVGMLVFAYTAPVLVEAGRELAGGRGPGPATGLYLTMFVAMCFASGSYAVRWPERCWPGRFDLIGHSHQMMHVGVSVAYCLEWLFVVWTTKQHVARSQHVPVL